MIEESYNSFKEFSELAKSDMKSSQKIGFDEVTRNTSVDQILFNDMIDKVNYLLESNLSNSNILDIGCGCSYFTNFLIKHSALNNNNLYLVDSEEMLSNISTKYDKVIKIPGKFPISMPGSLMSTIVGKIDLVILNSVVQHVFLENNLLSFIENAIKYLDSFGIIYIGDIPNASMQNRQLDNHDDANFKRHRILGDMRINDSIIFSLFSYFRGLGFNAYLLPKPLSYKFSNSREDLIITKI